MKSILISIKPKWVAKILNGEKTSEIRKTAPKCELPIDVYIYCTNEKNKYLYWDWYDPPYVENEWFVSNCKQLFAPRLEHKKHKNGKIVAKFTLREVEKFDFISEQKYKDNILKYNEEIRKHNRICKEACMGAVKVVCYLDKKCLGVNNPSGMIGYAWHISDLEIFDEPKKLSDFGLKRAPQSWCYVGEDD